MRKEQSPQLFTTRDADACALKGGMPYGRSRLSATMKS
jgi:hypothetical protein